MKKFSFQPIVDENSKILILGTMPGNKSLKLNQYYANPRNQFWKIMAFLTGEDFSISYEAKIKLLLKNNIAIWDVLMHCEREGSLDVNISDEVPNDFKSLFEKYPNIKSILFNGAKAKALFQKYFSIDKTKIYHDLPDSGNEESDTANWGFYLKDLPSSSGANTRMTQEQKNHIWKKEIDWALCNK